MAQQREFQLVSFGFGWLAILPYYKRISFVLFLMHLYQYWIGLGACVGGAEKVKGGYESLDFHCRDGEWQASGGKSSLN